MVKKKVGGGKRYKTVANAKAAGKEPAWAGPAPPTHLQKKITKKVNFLGKVAKTHTDLHATKGGVAKKAAKPASKRRGGRPLPDLSSLDAVLQGLQQDQAAAAAAKAAAGGRSSNTAATHGVHTARQRQRIRAQETARVQKVLQHPAYLQDPLAALQHHLTATLPPAPSRTPQPVANGKRKNLP